MLSTIMVAYVISTIMHPGVNKSLSKNVSMCKKKKKRQKIEICTHSGFLRIFKSMREKGI